MATLTIKNLPDAVYERLKARASENRRSINSEAILAVERGLAAFDTQEPEELLATLRRARARFDRPFLGDKALTTARSSGRA